MAPRTPADGYSGRRNSQCKANLMDSGRQKKVPSNSKAGHNQHRRYAMNSAETGKADSELVKTLAPGGAAAQVSGGRACHWKRHL
ncbi:MAG: hypothetical protein AAFZ11_05060 [Pseudomonadota bacterium]